MVGFNLYSEVFLLIELMKKNIKLIMENFYFKKIKELVLHTLVILVNGSRETVESYQWLTKNSEVHFYARLTYKP